MTVFCCRKLLKSITLSAHEDLKQFSGPCEKPEIENGEVSPTSETVKSGESYEVTCSSGHSLSEPTLSTLTCTNGELSTLPTCEPGIETSLHLEVEFFIL